MKHKFLPSPKIIFALITSLLTLNGFAQNTSNSPYSSFGIGETNDVDHAIFSGIGNCNISYSDSTVLNYFNPSSYHTLSKGQPILSTGLASRISTFSENEINATSSNVVLSHFALGFSFANRFGLAFGFKPYSRRGYEFSSSSTISEDTIKNTYKGTGSTNEAFIGFSSRIIKYKSFELAAGANLGYVFGTLSNKRISQLNSLISGGVDHKNLDVDGLHYDLGFNISQKINEKHSLSYNFVWTPSQQLNAIKSTNLFYAPDVLDESKYFRLDSTGDISGKITTASTYRFGLNYRFSFKDVAKKSKIRNSEMSFHANYSFSNWKEYSETYNGVNESPTFYDTYKLAIGLQYTPETAFLSASNSSIIERVRYRAGFYNYTLPIQQSLNTISDYGFTFGLGIPVMVQKSMSSINIGLGYGKRSNGVSTDFSENYMSINFSLIMAPGNFEKWFVKRKYN